MVTQARFTYPMTQNSLTRRIAALSFARDKAQAKAAQADQEWRDEIVGALMRGVSAADVAEAAGITRQRVYQIRDGKR